LGSPDFATDKTGTRRAPSRVRGMSAAKFADPDRPKNEKRLIWI
jgi:hypothetical protein